jgi:CRP/FNR family transcriptional regulator, cyclic AMP receptor protein
MERVVVAEHDPELLGTVRRRREEFLRASVAPLLRLPTGPWDLEEGELDGGSAPGGLLLLSGLLARSIRLGRRTAMEFLGPGDLIRPWVQMGDGSTIAVDARWVVHQQALIAVLDRDFQLRTAPWPELSGVLMDRLVLRARGLAFHLAICSQRGAARRVLLVLWHFADRWGRVTPDGVLVPVPLTHELLAAAVGATRPTVSTAAGELVRRGLVARGPGATWVLRGDPPPELRAFGDRAG